MLTLRELAEDPNADGPVIVLVEQDDGGEHKHALANGRFSLRGHRRPSSRRWAAPEVWRFINLTGDTHPMHVHLDAFQVLARHPAVVELDEAMTTAVRRAPSCGSAAHPTTRSRTRSTRTSVGLKDTVRVNANEVVDIVVRFSSYAGRYMYHCHILEHEDHDMMRPFVVMPAELMPFM